MHDEARYATLRDYLALLNRQRWVVLVVALALGGAVFALSSGQEETYQAQASIIFGDLTDELAFLGTTAPVTENSLQRASKEAERVTRLDVARRVKRRLDAESSAESLQSAISTRVGIQTSFVELTAEWTDPRFAAQLANEFAKIAINESNKEDKLVLDTLIEGLEQEARSGRLDAEDLLLNPEALLARQQLVRLEPLQDSFEAATFARRAEVPSDPVAPKVARNTVIGLIVGLALGLLVAFVRDSLDRRIHTSRDAHQRFGYPVVGRVPMQALGSAGLLSDGRWPVTAIDLDAFRILRTNLAALDSERPPRTVLVTSGLAQEGKSTVAAALAAASAAAGQRTLLVEADLRRPVLAQRTRLRPEPGLADYLAGTASPAEILQTVPIGAGLASANGDPAGRTRSDRALVAIAAGTIPSEPAEMLASERCRDFLRKVGKAYDLVVIDSSPMLSTADPLELMPYVDGVLICVRLASSTTDEAKAVTGTVALLPARPTGLVVTGVGAGDYTYYGYYG